MVLVPAIFLFVYITTSFMTNFWMADISVSITLKSGSPFFAGNAILSLRILALLMLSPHEYLWLRLRFTQVAMYSCLSLVRCVASFRYRIKLWLSFE